MAHLVNSKKLELVGVQRSCRNRQEISLEKMGVPSMWQPCTPFSGD